MLYIVRLSQTSDILIHINKMTDGTVSCVLCDALISVRMGNFYKFQLHMENDHDVFRHQDLVMALSFLDTEEQEVIIEKVLPRMKDVLDAAVKTAQNKTLSGPDTLHKRLSDMENISETTSQEGCESNSDITENETDKKTDVETENKNIDNTDCNTDTRTDEDTEALLESTNDGDSELSDKENTNENIRTLNQMKLREKKRMSYANCELSLKAPPKEVLCPICDQMIKKYKFNTHKRNCQILRKLRLEKFMESKDEPGAKSPYPKGPTPLEKLKATTEKKSEGKKVWTPELFECKVCNKQYTFERHLMKHVQKAHISLSA